MSWLKVPGLYDIAWNTNLPPSCIQYEISLKPQLHIHDFGHDRATKHPDLSSRDASAWVVAAP